MTCTLCPAQKQAFQQLQRLLPLGNIFILSGATGRGRTTVLEQVQAEQGGALLTLKDYFHTLRSRHPQALEETFEQLVLEALLHHELVCVDDLDVLYRVIGGGCHFYQRNRLIDGPLTTLATYAAQAGKRLVFSIAGDSPEPLRLRAHTAAIPDFGAGDFEFLCRAFAGDGPADLMDFRKILRFSRELNAHHLKAAGQWLRHQETPADTDALIEYLRVHRLVSNVNLDEVQEVDLHDLEGVDDVIRSLEANIIIPLENDALAAELNLKPKRGVLLAGPPGTGKTTVGRALAHRLKSKFFMLDGGYIAGSHQFFEQVHRLFEEAKRNAPSVLFIDDGDVLFTAGDVTSFGLYRYLLTLLDGLETNSAGRVCVMLTVMDVGRLPPALMRSGRIELWLDMRLPDAAARAAILRRQSAGLPPALAEVNVGQVAALTEGFSGADLKRLVEDAKALLAHDRVNGRPVRLATAYFEAAIETVVANKRRYAEAEASAQVPPGLNLKMFS
jgi:transitional endoplasmic reticulum ATPase